MTDLIEVETTDLAGEALGWAVGKAEGLELELEPPHYGASWRVFARHRYTATEEAKRYNPWEDWSLGGNLIDKYSAMIRGYPNQMYESLAIARVRISGALAWQSGQTPLIALCRVIVAAKVGDIVQVPKELMVGPHDHRRCSLDR
ncbi:phage protein NinX family protein [Pseudomonas sp. DE0157]|uniref:phage protein NinX family protein n=1 Tax=Pseudomonas sp. DE0157 TaxID=2584952 RepID=UPI0011A9C253|nr:phage protein NinX family protein [Pseudomonas sp. DE0157]